MSRLISAQANQVDADVASRAGVNICRGQHVVTVSGTEDALRRVDNASCEAGVVLSGHCLGPSIERAVLFVDHNDDPSALGQMCNLSHCMFGSFTPESRHL